MKRTCEICGKEYESNSRKFLHCCSKECLKIKKENETKSQFRICEWCGKEYWWEDKGNWNKNNEQVILHDSSLASSVVDSKKFCCYACGKAKNSNKAKETHLVRYGGIGYASDQLRLKAREKTKILYGDENYSNREKSKQTCLERYGTENVCELKETREKLRNAIKNAYRLHGDEIKEKRKRTCFKKYGVEYSSQAKEVKTKIRNTNLKRYGKECAFENEQVKNKIIKTCLSRYGVMYPCMTTQCRESGLRAKSKRNESFSKKLLSMCIENCLEFSLGKYSFDVKASNTLIEINPTVTHSSSDKKYFPLTRIKQKDKSYHYNKTNFARNNGYKCINIWDWDDEDKIINMLRPRKKLYARKLSIREVPVDECCEFLLKYHLQNSCSGQKIRYGLYLGNELIEVMTFGKPRYNKKYEYELLRLCTKVGYEVVGGAERLFKYFISHNDASSVISYCDNSKFSGDVYLRLGMKLQSHGKPSKHWFNFMTGRHITDNLLRQQGYSRLHGDKDYKLAKRGESNEILMLKNDYLEIYDCGQDTYIWKK